jgi:outer membrane protein assembly factor BamB
MKQWLFCAILIFLVPVQASAASSSPHSNWSSLDADAARSNSNPLEKTLTAANVLRLKVKWALPIPTQSYPVVADGKVYIPLATRHKIHVRAFNVLTGKPIHTYPQDASGGLLATSAGLVVAGRLLQLLDPLSGAKLEQMPAPTPLSGGTYLDPSSDGKVLLVGYATTTRSSSASLYTIDPTTGTILHKLVSSTAQGTIGSHGRILTVTTEGGAFYDETSGRAVARQASLFGPWFAGSTLSYTVGSMGKKPVSLFAYDGTGQRVWKRALGPPYIVDNWPHAVTPTNVFVERVKPSVGVEALDALTGAVLWNKSIPNVQRLAEANGILYVLTYSLGLPIKVVALKAATGKIIGVIGLSSAYYAYPEQNDLMIANGMLFIRAVGPNNLQELVALGL